MRLEIYLIRHGETAWSITGQHTGLADIPLTAQGEEAAKHLSACLKQITFSYVFTSPRVRARRTGELAGCGATAQVEPNLGEWNYGNYEGKTSEEIHRLQPDWNLFRDGCPGGESPEQMVTRVDSFIHKLRGLNGRIAIFSHGHFLRVLAVRWIGLPVIEAQRFLLGTASVSILGYEQDKPAKPVIAQWNAK